MEEETIDSLRRYRRTTIATIEAEKKKLAGIELRLREKIREAIDSLSADGVDVEGLNPEPQPENQKRERKARGPMLPRGYWMMAIATFLLKTRKVHFHGSEFIEWLQVPREEKSKAFAALASPNNATLLRAVGGANFAIREGVTAEELQAIIDQKTAEGISLDAIRKEPDGGITANGAGAGNGIAQAA